MSRPSFGAAIWAIARACGRSGAWHRPSSWPRTPSAPGYKKAGVTFLDLVATDRVQGGLFDRPDDARSIRRMRAIDELNASFGRGAIGFGESGCACGGALSTRPAPPAGC